MSNPPEVLSSLTLQEQSRFCGWYFEGGGNTATDHPSSIAYAIALWRDSNEGQDLPLNLNKIVVLPPSVSFDVRQRCYSTFFEEAIPEYRVTDMEAVAWVLQEYPEMVQTLREAYPKVQEMFPSLRRVELAGSLDSPLELVVRAVTTGTMHEIEEAMDSFEGFDPKIVLLPIFSY